MADTMVQLLRFGGSVCMQSAGRVHTAGAGQSPSGADHGSIQCYCNTKPSGAIQAADCGTGSEHIRSLYNAVRSAASALAPVLSAEDQGPAISICMSRRRSCET